jgi:SAM-dependent methyltransferase
MAKTPTGGPAITDVAGEGATALQLERLCNRYYWAAPHCRDSRVLEVACGTGQGLGFLAREARLIVGGDVSAENTATARRTYGGRVPLLRLDAQRLPIKDGAVDVVILLETLYFLPAPDDFAAEACRVLAPGGRLLLSVINKDCSDYNPHNANYHRHYGVTELTALAASHGLAPECFGALPMTRPPARVRLLGPVKRIAGRLRLIPQRMQAKLLLKRLLYGPLLPLPFEITPESACYRVPTPIPTDRADSAHQVVLCVARRA